MDNECFYSATLKLPVHPHVIIIEKSEKLEAIKLKSIFKKSSNTYSHQTQTSNEYFGYLTSLHFEFHFISDEARRVLCVDYAK